MHALILTFSVLLILMTSQAFASPATALLACANEDKSVTLDIGQDEIFEDASLKTGKLTERIDISIHKRAGAPYVQGAGFAISKVDQFTQVLDRKQNKIVLVFADAEMNAEERKHYARKITILRSECAKQSPEAADAIPMTVLCKKVDLANY